MVQHNTEELPVATLQCRLRELMAEKSRREGRPITYRVIRQSTKIALNTLSGLNQTPLPRLIGTTVIERLCAFFACEVGDLFVVVFSTAQEEGASSDD